MKNLLASARPVMALALMAGLGACDIKDNLLEPQQPGVIGPEATESPTAADALRKGALDRLRSATEGGGAGGLWSMSGLLADEWKSGDTFTQRIETDGRTIQLNNAEVIDEYRAQHRARQSARDAIVSLVQYLPTPLRYQAEMWWVMGFAEMNLSENWCNGVPFGILVDGEPIYGAPKTSAEGLTLAMTHLDSALALASETDTAAVTVRRAIQITRARVLLAQGQYVQAALAVAGIPTSYRYVQTHSLTTFDVANWSLNNSQKRWVVSDSFDASGRILNAIPFASAGDPRVPVQGQSAASTLGRAFDTSTPFVQQTIWARSDMIPILSGVDARLIEAEDRLRANDITGMMTILNTLRASAQYLGSAYSSPVMAALPIPPDQATAMSVFFREKAFWQFGRGYRLPDLRRMVRQYSGAPYGKTVANTYPGGTFFKTGLAYGGDITFPVTTDETPNSLWSGNCLDRNP
jgi:starch-binding outer membrane protein, SusD/RagB family